MSEAAPAERVPEAKYRYLVDLSRQESPNLRKHYRDSLPLREESGGRSLSSGRRPSLYSSEKRSTFIARQSPSCSTFAPRRESTQEEFSPYNDKTDREGGRSEELRADNSLLRSENSHLRTQNGHLRTENSHLRTQNGHLRGQISRLSAEAVQARAQLVKAGQANQELQVQVLRRQQQLVQVREASRTDLCYFQKVVAEMTNQIQLVLTKNKMLEQELALHNAKLQTLHRPYDSLAACNNPHKEQGRSRGVSGSSTQPQSRRSVGKLMSRPGHRPCLGTSKIKIEDESEPSPEPPSEQPSRRQQGSSKGEQLVESIRAMHLKIRGVQAGSLRQLWKWLKSLGHSQSCLKKWKGRAEAGASLPAERLRDLLREGCSLIQ